MIRAIGLSFFAVEFAQLHSARAADGSSAQSFYSVRALSLTRAACPPNVTRHTSHVTRNTQTKQQLQRTVIWIQQYLHLPP